MGKNSIYYKVQKKINNGEFSDSETILNELLRKNQSDFNALKMLAYTLISKSNFSDSLPLIQRARKINSDVPDLLYYDAFANFRLNNISEAKQIINFAKTKFPSDEKINWLEELILFNESVYSESHYAGLKLKFDENFESYDDGRTRTNYETPYILFEEVKKLAPNGFGRVLDLGCGTGLSGELFCNKTDYLCGVDLSLNMMQKALDKKIYNELTESDILSYLKGADSNSWNVIIASSVFIYFSDLTELFEQISRVLCMGGVACFDLNLEKSKADFSLFSHNGMQFSHSKNYVLDCAKKKTNLKISNVVETYFEYINVGEKHKGLVFSFTK